MSQLATEVVGTCPASLAAAIRREVWTGGSWEDTAHRVAAALRRRVPGPDLLTPEQLLGDPTGYQTHLVHAEEDGSFSVVVMVWRPGQTTPVHDHLTWCVTAVLQGAEYEEIFTLRGGRQDRPGRARRVPGARSSRHVLRRVVPGLARIVAPTRGGPAGAAVPSLRLAYRACALHAWRSPLSIVRSIVSMSQRYIANDR